MILAVSGIRGFKKAIDKHRLDESDSKAITTGLYIEEGEKVVQELIDNDDLPEAFFCVNDPVAIGAMKALKRNNIKIPDQVAVIGFSESPVVEIIEPPLSSVIQPTFEMGHKAANILLEHIESENKKEPETIFLEGKLSARASSVKKK